MKSYHCPTCVVEIFVAGQRADVDRVCSDYVFKAGLCVSVESVSFLYTGGREEGAVVRLVNYPRFPSTPEALMARARDLADLLVVGCHQHSVLIVSPDGSEWLTRREEGK